MANRRGEALRDACERVLLSFWSFSHGKMSGSAQKESAYDDDSTGDEYDQGKTDFWREFRPHFECDASLL